MNKKNQLFLSWQKARIVIEINKIWKINPYKIKRKFRGRKVLSDIECHELISKAIYEKKPFAVGRYGLTEGRTMFFADAHNMEINVKGKYEEYRENVSNLSGMFSNDDENLNRFVEIYEKAGSNIDLFAVWGVYWERYLIKNYISPKCDFAAYAKMSFFNTNMEIKHWTRALEGKKVLVVSSFAETIEQQYFTKRERIWPELQLLPEFELHTVKAVQTLAGNRDPRFNTWFDALDYMTDECLRVDFDVAILGCGAYGLPLAARIKDAGKIAIVVGGDIQLLFGIKGSRWENEPVAKYYNDAWVYPGENEKIKKAEGVENACYW